MITVRLCSPDSLAFIWRITNLSNNKINYECEKYVDWIVENGVRGHIYNDLEARFENEIDAVAFKLKFGL